MSAIFARTLAISAIPVVIAGCMGAGRMEMACFDPLPALPGPHASVVSVHKMGGGIDVADAPDGADRDVRLRPAGGPPVAEMCQ